MDWASIYREFVVTDVPSSTMKNLHGGYKTQNMNGQTNLKTLLEIDGCTQKYMDIYMQNMFA